MKTKDFFDSKLLDPEDVYYASAHIKEDDLENLSEEQKKRLVRWIARIMERAYRRGVQQTLHLKNKNEIDAWILDDPHVYRYGKCLDISIGLDGFTTTSIFRLSCEENLDKLRLPNTEEVYQKESE